MGWKQSFFWKLNRTTFYLMEHNTKLNIIKIELNKFIWVRLYRVKNKNGGKYESISY